jgi:hypothetical protein
MILIQAFLWNVGTCWFNVKGRGFISNEAASTNVNQRGGVTRSSNEICESRWSKGVTLFSQIFWSTSNGKNQK